ncbi:MAG: hypothetical protein WDN01_20590 [Rhizomicrobium sp.]
MAVSKFAVACIAAVLAGGATAGLASNDAHSIPAQVAEETPVTPISAIGDPARLLNGVSARFVSGQSFGRVVAVSTDAAGHATRVRVALDGMPSTHLWIDQSDLVYSRARDSIVAHDVHAPAMTVASR